MIGSESMIWNRQQGIRCLQEALDRAEHNYRIAMNRGEEWKADEEFRRIQDLKMKIREDERQIEMIRNGQEPPRSFY